jgi:hypothetical protein
MARPFLVPFRRLLRLAGSRWRYSTPPPHGYWKTLRNMTKHLGPDDVVSLTFAELWPERVGSLSQDGKWTLITFACKDIP